MNQAATKPRFVWLRPASNVSVSFNDGGRRVVMLATPAQARGWIADTLRQEGAEDLADALRLAAWEAMKL